MHQLKFGLQVLDGKGGKELETIMPRSLHCRPGKEVTVDKLKQMQRFFVSIDVFIFLFLSPRFQTKKQIKHLNLFSEIHKFILPKSWSKGKQDSTNDISTVSSPAIVLQVQWAPELVVLMLVPDNVIKQSTSESNEKDNLNKLIENW